VNRGGKTIQPYLEFLLTVSLSQPIYIGKAGDQDAMPVMRERVVEPDEWAPA
jgi:hypothetical protein